MLLSPYLRSAWGFTSLNIFEIFSLPLCSKNFKKIRFANL